MQISVSSSYCRPLKLKYSSLNVVPKPFKLHYLKDWCGCFLLLLKSDVDFSVTLWGIKEKKKTPQLK